MDKVIILAAGEGTRMKSNISKVLHKVCNRSMLSYIIDASKEANIDQIYVIVGENEQKVKEEFGDSINYIKQEIGENHPYGTGYAVKLASDYINDEDNIFVTYGDVPLIKSQTIREIIEYHKKEENNATVASAIFENPYGYGRIIKDDGGFFSKIVEHKDCNANELLVKEINSGIYVFNGNDLKNSLDKLDTNNSQGEMYITDVFEILSDDKLQISTFVIQNRDEIKGVNNKLQLSEVEEIMRKRINEKFMLDGVIFENPSTTTIEKNVKIGKDTVIESNVKILGNTVIGENSLIGMNSRITNSQIGNNVEIYSSFIDTAKVEDNSDVGPFARLRPNAHIKENVHIGNFVEVKNSSLGKNTKSGHLAYIGDSDIGDNVNIGCGVIFANYDGENKFRSKVGNNSFIGSNANIISPINIEDNGYIAAGSTITKDVKNGQLAVERAEQRNIDGYYNKKFKK